MKFVPLLLAALLAMAAAQSLSPTPSGSPLTSGSPAVSPSTSGSPAASPSGLSQFTNCNTLLLNGTRNFDIVLLGSASPSASGSPSASSSPAASGSPATSISGSPAASSAVSRSPAVSTSGSPAASPSLANASPSLSTSPSASLAASSSPAASAAASSSPAISPSANIRLLEIANSLLGGRVAVNGNALLTNTIVGGSLNCVSASATASASGSPALSSSPAASGSPASSISGSPAASTAVSRSPTASISGSPVASPSAALSSSPAASGAAVSGSPSASISGSPAASPTPSGSSSPVASSAANLSLLVTGNLAVSNTQLACGGLAVGGQLTGTPTFGQANAPNLSGSAGISSSNINLASLRTQLLASSNELCSLSSTGRLSLNNGIAVFDASASGSSSSSSTSSTSSLNSTSASVTLFNLTSADLANLTAVRINGTQANGFVIINVIDQSAASSNISTANLTLSGFGTDVGSLNASHLLWNFCNASNIVIDNIMLLGTILAPRSTVNITRAELEGSLIAESLTGPFRNLTSSQIAAKCSRVQSNAVRDSQVQSGAVGCSHSPSRRFCQPEEL